MRNLGLALPLLPFLLAPQAAHATFYEESPLGFQCAMTLTFMVKRGSVPVEDAARVMSLALDLAEPHQNANKTKMATFQRAHLQGAIAAINAGTAPSVADCEAALPAGATISERPGIISRYENWHQYEPAVLTDEEARIVHCRATMLGETAFGATAQSDIDAAEADSLVFVAAIGDIADRHGNGLIGYMRSFKSDLAVAPLFGDYSPVSVDACRALARSMAADA